MFRRAGIKTDSFILQKRDRDYHGGEITLLILTVVFGTFAPVGTAPTLTYQNTVNVNATMLAVSSEFGFDGDPLIPYVGLDHTEIGSQKPREAENVLSPPQDANGSGGIMQVNNGFPKIDLRSLRVNHSKARYEAWIRFGLILPVITEFPVRLYFQRDYDDLGEQEGELLSPS